MVELIDKKGRIKSLPIDVAERWLRFKEVNPMQSWEIKGDKYTFDGKTIKKKETPTIKEIPKKETIKKED